MASDGPTAGEFLLGLRVIDRQDEDFDAAVTNTRGVPAHEWEAGDEHTVANAPSNEPSLDDPPSTSSSSPRKSTSMG